MSGKRVMKLASEGKRFGAFCIDMIIPVISGILFFIAFILLIAAYDPFMSGFGYGYPYGYGYGYGYGQGGLVASGGLTATLIIAILLSIAYVAVQMVFYSRSKTLGKAVLGLQVVSSKDGRPIGFWKMLFREWFVKSASGSVFMLGFIWVLIDEKNRGWHDKILDTYVIDVKESEAINLSRSGYSYQTPTPEPTPAYAPETQAAYGTSAAALADKEPAAPLNGFQETVTVSEEVNTLEDAVRLEGDGRIMDNVLEIAEVVAVTAQDAVGNAGDNTDAYDEVSAVTAEVADVTENGESTEITEGDKNE